MKIINANIQADLSVCSIEEGLLQLKPKSMAKVILLVSGSYSFQDIYSLFNHNQIKTDISKIMFSLENVDSSEILINDSWMLIDYESNTMYYSEGA